MKQMLSQRVLSIAVIALLLCAGLLVVPAHAADPLDTAECAIGLLSQGEAEAARTALMNGGSGDDASPMLLAAQATVDLYAGKLPIAETTYRKALAGDMYQLTALWGLSLCLLNRGCVFEASTVLERAAAVAPNDARVKVLQAYTMLLLDRPREAALAGKLALDGGEQSPFLLAVLAEIHRRMGYAQKALEFGNLAAKHFENIDFLSRDLKISLPLSMIITDTPQALTKPGKTAPALDPGEQRTDLEIELPRADDDPVALKTLEITTPKPDASLHGVQRVQAVYRGTTQVKFVTFLVDRTLRGLTTELPYSFTWDTNTVAAGEHQLTIRAYDYRGSLLETESITVVTAPGQPLSTPEVPARVASLQKRIMTLTMPQPAPSSLFSHLGYWYQDVGELPPALDAFEKAAAIDPSAEGILDVLGILYAKLGMHSLSPSGEVSCAPARPGQLRIALTFDDGPNPLYTPSILTELKRYNARATFFLVGKMVQLYPDLTTQIMGEGHELANHSYTHPNMTKLTKNEIVAEVLRTRTMLKDVTGQQTYLFRPPGGNIDAAVIKQLRQLDYNIIYWDINAGEFRKMTPEEQAAQISSRARDGSILMLHNGPVDGTLTILPTLLAQLNRRGFSFVTVTELMSGNGQAK
ncbi:MAG: polysaccharide deacetylase family protein [Armatimonadota bacterium]